MPPSVTVAIPLHNSLVWIDNVVANVRALPPMVTEIIISDQTCLDDAAEQIAAQLADDPRVVVLAEDAGLGFVDHYHLLLEKGRGELFMWMPHDDIFDPQWVPTLAKALEAYPNAWLAFGRLRSVEIDGVTPTGRGERMHMVVAPGEIEGWAALEFMLRGWMGYPFRGLFRRELVLAAGVLMEPDSAIVGVDKEWVFAVALHSALVYDDRAVTWKRRYAGSTAASQEWRASYSGDLGKATLGVLRRHGPPGVEGFTMRAYAYAYSRGRYWGRRLGLNRLRSRK